MEINDDPSDRPTLDPDTLRLAQEMRLHPVAFVCDPPNAESGDASGVSFTALVYSVPQQGERVTLEDGRACEVRRVYHQVGRIQDPETGHSAATLLPTVYAVLLGSTEFG